MENYCQLIITLIKNHYFIEAVDHPFCTQEKKIRTRMCTIANRLWIREYERRLHSSNEMIADSCKNIQIHIGGKKHYVLAMGCMGPTDSSKTYFYIIESENDTDFYLVFYTHKYYEIEDKIVNYFEPVIVHTEQKISNNYEEKIPEESKKEIANYDEEEIRVYDASEEENI